MPISRCRAGSRGAAAPSVAPLLRKLWRCLITPTPGPRARFKCLMRVTYASSLPLLTARAARIEERQKAGGPEDSDADKYFRPLQLACHNKSPKVKATALDTLQKLIGECPLSPAMLFQFRSPSDGVARYHWLQRTDTCGGRP